MFGKTLMIAGGVVEIDFVKEYLREKKFDTVVCADSGLDAAYRLKLPVHYAMGDFDSVSREALAYYQSAKTPEGVTTEFVRYPAEKDATDSHLALDWVVGQLPAEIQVLGATGRRLDHFLANMSILMKPLSYGIPTCLVDRYNKIYLMDHSHVIRREEMFGKYISFLPFTEEVSAVYLRGFKYELDGQNLTLGDSIGVSNEMGEGNEAGLVEFGDGVLIVVESRD
jgi:thiamine pyrophosphokinase